MAERSKDAQNPTAHTCRGIRGIFVEMSSKPLRRKLGSRGQMRATAVSDRWLGRLSDPDAIMRAKPLWAS